jgi:hypothetical protein
MARQPACRADGAAESSQRCPAFDDLFQMHGPGPRQLRMVVSERVNGLGFHRFSRITPRCFRVFAKQLCQPMSFFYEYDTGIKRNIKQYKAIQ